MKRKEFKENLFATLNNPVDGMSYDEKMILVHSLLVDYEKDNEEKYTPRRYEIISPRGILIND